LVLLRERKEGRIKPPINVSDIRVRYPGAFSVTVICCVRRGRWKLVLVAGVSSRACVVASIHGECEDTMNHTCYMHFNIICNGIRKMVAYIISARTLYQGEP